MIIFFNLFEYYTFTISIWNIIIIFKNKIKKKIKLIKEKWYSILFKQ